MEQQLNLKNKTEEIQRTRDHLMQTKENLLSFSNAYEQNNAIMTLTGVVNSAKKLKQEKKIKRLRNLATRYKTDYSNFAITLLRKGKTSSHNSSTEVMNNASQSSKPATPACLTPGLKKNSSFKREKIRRKSHYFTWANHGFATEKIEGVPQKAFKKSEESERSRWAGREKQTNSKKEIGMESHFDEMKKKEEENSEISQRDHKEEEDLKKNGLFQNETSVHDLGNKDFAEPENNSERVISTRVIAEKRKRLREIKREYEKRIQDHEEKVKTIKYLQNDLKLNYDHLRPKIDLVGKDSQGGQPIGPRNNSTNAALAHAKNRYRYSMVQTNESEQKETKSQHNVNLKPSSSRYGENTVGNPGNHRYVPASFNERDLTPTEMSKFIVERQFSNDNSPSSLEGSSPVPPVLEKGGSFTQDSGKKNKDSGSSPMTKNIKELVAGKKRDAEYKNSISRIDGRENTNAHMSSSTDHSAMFQGNAGEHLSKSYRNNHSTRQATSRNIRMSSEGRSPGKQSPSKLMATSANFGHNNDRLGSLVSPGQAQKGQISSSKRMNHQTDEEEDPTDSIFTTNRVTNRTFNHNEGTRNPVHQEEIDLFERKREKSGSNSKRGNKGDLLNMSRNVRKGMNAIKPKEMGPQQTRYVSFADYFKMKSVSKTLHENGMSMETSQENELKFL